MMKKIITMFILLFISFILVGCEYYKSPGTSDLIYHAKYERYYQYKNAMKGIELYCFEKDSEYYCCLMGGTNRLKTVDEIKQLQDELPCPVSIMKDILLTYSALDRENIVIIVTSNPPTAEEIDHSFENDIKNKDIIVALIENLGLKTNNALESVMITPIFCSGMIYANIGDEVKLSFDVNPTNTTYTNVSWYSTDYTIATVNNKGEVRIIKEGTVTIIISVDGVVDSIPIKVDGE